MVDVARAPPLPRLHSKLDIAHASPKQATKARDPNPYPEEVLNLLTSDPLRFKEYQGDDEEPNGRYTPINEKKEGSQVNGVVSKPSFSYDSPTSSKRQRLSSSSTPTPPSPPHDLFTGRIDVRWSPNTPSRASGLRNGGNTCFLNSVLQVWAHTPALLNYLRTVEKDHAGQCKCDKHFNRSCLSQTLIETFHAIWDSGRPFYPKALITNIRKIGPFHPGRQEDAHEFLRCGIDKLQKNELIALGKTKAPHDVKETTWIHKIWGGRLLSRVTCLECHHHSDTFDTLLDLSLDVRNCETVEDCLKAFTKEERLEGKNKYKCEKCKKLVNATKQFIIAKAPPVLTIHLKRFKPLGGKITRPLGYRATLDLNDFALENGLNYELFGVTHHQGSGPHFGHYYSTVRNKDGKWFEMNDDDVHHVSPPLDKQSAYLLHYVLKQGAKLDAAIAGQASNGSKKVPQTRSTQANGTPNGHAESSALATRTSSPPSLPVEPFLNGGEKRKREDADDSESPIGSPAANRPLKNKSAPMKGKFTPMKDNNFYGNSKKDETTREDATPNDTWQGRWSPSKKKKITDHQAHHTFRAPIVGSKQTGKSRPNASPYSVSSRGKGGGGHGGSRQNQRKGRF